MIAKKTTIPILFSGGAYGSFLEWCLLYFSGQTNVHDPTGMNNNSHNFNGCHLIDMQGWRKYLNNSNFKQIVRFHYKTSKFESAIDNINEVLGSVDKAILIYCGMDNILFNINNKFDKIYKEGWLLHNQYKFRNDLIAWGKHNLQDMEKWELREFLSFYVQPQHLDETEVLNLQSFSSTALYKININDLLNNFETTICLALQWSNLKTERIDFDRVYNNWLPKQIHRNKDKLVGEIVQSVINESNFSWQPEQLTIVDEAFIQMKLRVLHKLELRCYNLNVFPTNTNELKKLLFNV